MVSYKKAISPVVATALLLVVAVVAVVGFQSWFTTYQSGINVKVEQESQAGSSITIERLEQTGKVYVKNTAVNNVTVDVSVSGCTGTASGVEITGQSIGNATPSGCSMTKDKEYDVVVVSPTGVYQATMIAR